MNPRPIGFLFKLLWSLDLCKKTNKNQNLIGIGRVRIIWKLLTSFDAVENDDDGMVKGDEEGRGGE